MAEPAFTCPDVKVTACTVCPPPPVCPGPKIEIQKEYIGTLPHWCEASVCTGGEAAGLVVLVIVCLAVGIGAYSLITYARNELLEHGNKATRQAFDLAKDKAAADRLNALESLKIEQQRLDMVFADKLREDHRVVTAKRAALDPFADAPVVKEQP